MITTYDQPSHAETFQMIRNIAYYNKVFASKLFWGTAPLSSKYIASQVGYASRLHISMYNLTCTRQLLQYDTMILGTSSVNWWPKDN